MQLLDKTAYIYTPLFCEENIWKLINALYTNQLAKPIDVLFILNQTNTIALFGQTSADIDKPVIWDYHVVLTALYNGEMVVFDFDSRCDFPAKLIDYYNETFPQELQLKASYQPLIKSIKPDYYFKHFYSDRLHMKNVIDDSELPDYDIIKPEKTLEKLTLINCRDLDAQFAGCQIELPENYFRRFNGTNLLTPE